MDLCGKLISDAERLSLSYIRRYSYTDLHGKKDSYKKAPEGLRPSELQFSVFRREREKFSKVQWETYKFLYLFRKTQIFSKVRVETYRFLCLFRGSRWKPDSSVELKMHKID